MLALMLTVSTEQPRIITTEYQDFCAGDVNNDGVVNDYDLDLIRDDFDYPSDDIFDLVPMAYSYGDRCRFEVFLPIVYARDYE